MWLKIIQFNYLLPKMKLFVVWLVKIQDLLGWQQDFIIQPYYVEVASAIKISRLRHTCYKASYHQASRIDRTTRAIEQNIHRMLHSKNFQFYQPSLATPPFAAVSALLTKFLLNALKKCDLLATLVKFSQASNPHLPRQQKFVKTNTT